MVPVLVDEKKSVIMTTRAGATVVTVLAWYVSSAGPCPYSSQLYNGLGRKTTGIYGKPSTKIYYDRSY